jgi:hypothetical protein
MEKYIVHCKSVFSVHCYLLCVSVQSPMFIFNGHLTPYSGMNNDDTMTIAVRRLFCLYCILKEIVSRDLCYLCFTLS